ncbi:hypothetical protein FRB99_001838 [Tulasnella sp. 403]|nr:hypothetical protein FRB99_001838 [Tulasnella sp. 403]
MLIGRGGNGSKGQGGSRRKSAPPAPERVHGPEIIDETYWIKTVKKAQSIHDTYDKDNEEQAFIIFLLDQKETEFRGVLQRVMNSSSIHILVRETAEDENPWTPIVEAVTRVTQKLMFLTDDQKREIQDAIDQVSVPCRDYMKVTAQWDSRLENGHDWVDAFLMQSAIEKLR